MNRNAKKQQFLLKKQEQKSKTNAKQQLIDILSECKSQNKNNVNRMIGKELRAQGKRNCGLVLLVRAL